MTNSDVLIPFGVTYNPMKMLALVNFEKDPDSIYVGLEPQYFDDEINGKGFRVIGWRKDGYVDVYDGDTLIVREEENFDLTGKGLCERIKVHIEDAVIDIKDHQATISFKFTDKYGRDVSVNIKERTKKPTKGISLLAPVGSASENPSSLALVFLYDFDFVRKHNTIVEVMIDGKPRKLDNFPVPVPKDFQWRYYTRYSPNCQIVDFAPSKQGVLNTYQPSETGIVTDGDWQFQFREGSLKTITLQNSRHPLIVEFENGLRDVRGLVDGEQYEDNFKIAPGPSMGYVSGTYTISRKGSTVTINLTPSGGWTGVPDSTLTKMLFKDKSVFCNWPRTYQYTQTINLDTLESSSKWERIR